MRRILPGIMLVVLLVAGLACAPDQPGSTPTPSPVTSPTPLPTAPKADFYAVRTVAEYPDLEVEFIDLSTGEIVAWEWDFTGDGRIDRTYAEETVSVSYGYPSRDRCYAVTLTVTGPGGTDTLTRDSYICVIGCPS